ncbi:MAG: Uma2 family endonuclease [Ignavibacteria bacterium]|jgi:Uma2 family endonuclease|nr:Uma2 family endonuclease [Ignavibacteria bacterium]
MELALDLNERYSFADYLTWLDDKRRELVNGFIMLMAGPSTSHSVASSNLHYYFKHYIKKHKGHCSVHHAPFDVRLPKNGEKDDKDIYTVVQPDVCIICDLSKLEERGCLGAPDFIAEVISPSNITYDTRVKYNLYQSAGVKEYWIVEPKNKFVEVNVLQDDGKYGDPIIFVEEGDVAVTTLPGLTISLSDIFEN